MIEQDKPTADEAHEYVKNARAGRDGGGGRQHQTQGEPQPSCTLGTLTLGACNPRRTASGKLTVSVSAYRAGRREWEGQVTGAESSRPKPAKTLAALAGVSFEEADAALVKLLAMAADQLDVEKTGPTIHAILAGMAPAVFGFTHRTPKGLWSEVYGREMYKAEVVGMQTTRMVAACETACDRPDGRGALLRRIAAEMNVVWGDLCLSLPDGQHSDLDAGTAAGQRFRSALIDLWMRPRLMQQERTGEGTTVASSASLVSRVRHRTDVIPAEQGGGEKWYEIHPAYSAWWRRGHDEDGKGRVFLAMRHELANQIGVPLPECHDQTTLMQVGTRYGCLADPEWLEGCVPPLPGELTDGEPLAVLSASMLDYVFGTPKEYAEVTAKTPGDVNGEVDDDEA